MMSEKDGNQTLLKESGGRVKLPQEAETILLVEDDEMVRQITREVLELQGYRVLEAVNGKDALDLCKNYGSPIDLVMTDVTDGRARVGRKTCAVAARGESFVYVRLHG